MHGVRFNIFTRLHYVLTTADSEAPVLNLDLQCDLKYLQQHFHLMDSGEVCDGTLDLRWHAGNENKLHYDVFL